MSSRAKSLLRSVVPTALVWGVVLSMSAPVSAVAAPKTPPPPPSRVSVPRTPPLTLPTPQPTTPPRVTTAAGSLPKVGQNPGPPRLVAAFDDSARQETLVFVVDDTGVLKGFVKKPDSLLDPSIGEPDGFWDSGTSLSGPIFPPGAPLSALYHPTTRDVDVFGIDNNGALENVRRVSFPLGPALWQSPVALSGPGFAPPRAPVASIWQPLNDQLEVYVVGLAGAVMGVWNENHGPWKSPFNLTADGFAPRFSELAAVWEPNDEMLEVFVADAAGALNGIWKLHDRAWEVQRSVTGPGFTSAGGPLAAVWEPSIETLDVFAVDQAGVAKVISKQKHAFVPLPIDVFGSPNKLFAEVSLQPNSLLAVAWREALNSPVVSVVDTAGAVHQSSRFRGTWQSGDDAATSAGFAIAGSQLAATRATVLGIDAHKSIRVRDNFGPGSPVTKPSFGPIYGAHAAYCQDVLRHYSSTTSQTAVVDCTDFLGLTKYCADHDGHLTADITPSGRQFVNCQQNSQSEGFLRQYEEIAKAVSSAVIDAWVALAPILGPGVEAAACSTGVIFACATLAIDISLQVAGEADLAPEVVDATRAAVDCANEDILACAKLGSQAVKATGLDIPGEDLVRAGQDGIDCNDGDFKACMRLGEEAADAAGVPVDAARAAGQEAIACANGDFEACTSLGKHAVQLGVTVRNVAGAADNLQACKSGDLAACGQLGFALAAVPR